MIQMSFSFKELRFEFSFGRDVVCDLITFMQTA